MGSSPEDHPRSAADQPLNRRQVLGLGAAVVAASVLVPATEGLAAPTIRAQIADTIRPVIRVRGEWAGERGATGELVPEDDVRFLLVHHTASTNEYRQEDVISQIRGFYNFHTRDKAWPDVAYNFFVDRFGGIWEGRQGSLDGPVRGDATGGSQGFALLCSLIGNFQEAPVPAAQQQGLVELLAWLGETYAIDTSPGALTTFTSRGSSRWPAGAEVTARTISGHRDMSTTGCPGDFAYPLLADDIPGRVSAIRQIATTTTTSTSSSSTSKAPSLPAQPDGVPRAEEGAIPNIPLTEDDDRQTLPFVIAGGVLAAMAAAGGLFSRLWKRADDVG